MLLQLGGLAVGDGIFVERRGAVEGGVGVADRGGVVLRIAAEGDGVDGFGEGDGLRFAAIDGLDTNLVETVLAKLQGYVILEHVEGFDADVLVVG